MERKKSSSTSSQVRTHSVPRTPTQVRHPHTRHSGPPKVSTRLEPSPAPKVQRPPRQRPHCPGSPPCNRHRLESGRGGVYVL